MQLFTLLLMAGLSQAKPASAPAPVAPPEAPKLPARLSFSDELAGRRAYWAARDATHNAPYSFQCALTVLQTNRGKTSPAQTATETLYATPDKKLAMSYEFGVPGRKLVRRALSDGESLLAVRFDERGKQTTREFSRVYFTAALRLDRALTYARLDPLGTSLGAQLALEAPRAMQTRLWKDLDGSILEADTLTPRAGRPLRIRRYRFTASHTLSAAEEWETREGRVTYRKEEYRPAPKVAAPFDQALPDSYTEQALKIPESTRELPQPASIDPKAAALLAKWEDAHERFYTFHALATVTTEQQKRTEISRDPRARGGRSGYNGTYDLWLQRPVGALVVIKGEEGFPVNQKLKADSSQIIVEDSEGKKRSAPVREGVRLELTLRQNALRSGLEPLQGLLEGSPRLAGYDEVRALAPTTLPDGTPVEGIELAKTTRSTDTGRQYTVETSDRIWLGRDGLPRRFESTRKTTQEGLFERDQAPLTIVTVQLTGLSTEREPPF